MTASSTVPGTLLLLLFAAGLFGFETAHAASELGVTISPDSPRNVPGSDARLTVRAWGDPAAIRDLRFAALGGSISGILSLADVGDGVVEGAIFVSRTTPGDVVVTVSSGGLPVTFATVHFAALGFVELQVALEADARASARTWRFELVDPAGVVVESLSAPLSGDARSLSLRSQPQPFGRYTARIVWGNDTRLACGPNVFYEVLSPPGGEAAVEVGLGTSVAAFTLRPCPGAPRDVDVAAPVDPLAPPSPTPTEDVRGDRTAGTPLPPRSGSGHLAKAGDGADDFADLFLPAAAAAAAAGFPAAWFVARRRPARLPDEHPQDPASP